ncbi:GMC family oxidoreductase N-terminal domain-containing protein [Gammaproteobacteria bacterium]|nr:GMC family oxidoreductase N-terminal domain-containing protein [Gammaproteobacteria bacterium]MDA9370663.1 GMC family oxidoreductase N-terminal domain-containing protein [Gammaproteobacteria bacterium]
MKFRHKYIIVGAGSAGCVLANKLSANPLNSVLLIEAGPKDNFPAIKMPLAASSLFKNKKYGWGYETEPEPNLNHRLINWPRGKTLGGSSSINGMVYIRGQAEDYESWEQAGNVGWGYKDLINHFTSLENNQNHQDGLHGSKGELWVETYQSSLEASNVFMEACAQAGFQENLDFNGQKQEGYGTYQVNIKKGQRFSAADAFLKPILGRPNLELLMGTRVTKIITSNNKAMGVLIKNKTGSHAVTCEAEIILCGGAINTPHVLMLSGIGPKQHLEDLNIHCHHDIPGVGQNLQDHLTVNIGHTMDGLKTFSELMRPIQMLKNLYHYFVRGKGLLTYPASDIGVFFKTSHSENTPNAQIHFAPGAGKYNKNGAMKPMSGITASVCNLRPKSVGFLKLQSSNPEDPPKIHANYLSHPADIQPIIDGIKRIRKIFQSSAMDTYNPKEIEPSAKYQSDSEVEELIRQESLSVYHPVGTCKMGETEECVVDSRLRVRGISGLRVADASIFPSIISGNTNATCNVIGSKCAEYILADT